MMGKQLLCIGERNLILEFGIHQTIHLRLDGQGGSLIANPHAHLAFRYKRNEPVGDLLFARVEASPAFIAQQELSFSLDGHLELVAAITWERASPLGEEYRRCRGPSCTPLRRRQGFGRLKSPDHAGENCQLLPSAL